MVMDLFQTIFHGNDFYPDTKLRRKDSGANSGLIGFNSSKNFAIFPAIPENYGIREGEEERDRVSESVCMCVYVCKREKGK